MRIQHQLIFVISFMALACASEPKAPELSEKVEMSEANEDGNINFNDFDPLPEAALEAIEPESTADEEILEGAKKDFSPEKERVISFTQEMQASAMRRMISDCSMMSEPAEGSEFLTKIPEGRKIWTEDAGGPWFKVYRKKGHAFVSKTCFEAK